MFMPRCFGMRSEEVAVARFSDAEKPLIWDGRSEGVRDADGGP